MSAPAAKGKPSAATVLAVLLLAVIFGLGLKDFVNRQNPAAGAKDTLSWAELAKARVRNQQASFPEAALAADGKRACVTGYMFPLQGAERQSHFLLSAYQPSCAFCLPGGYAEMIEVTDTAEKIDYALGTVTLCGVFKLLKTRAEREHGMLYRMTGATPAE